MCMTPDSSFLKIGKSLNFFFFLCSFIYMASKYQSRNHFYKIKYQIDSYSRRTYASYTFIFIFMIFILSFTFQFQTFVFIFPIKNTCTYFCFQIAIHFIIYICIILISLSDICLISYYIIASIIL